MLTNQQLVDMIGGTIVNYNRSINHYSGDSYRYNGYDMTLLSSYDSIETTDPAQPIITLTDSIKRLPIQNHIRLFYVVRVRDARDNIGRYTKVAYIFKTKDNHTFCVDIFGKYYPMVNRKHIALKDVRSLLNISDNLTVAFTTVTFGQKISTKRHKSERVPNAPTLARPKQFI